MLFLLICPIFFFFFFMHGREGGTTPLMSSFWLLCWPPISTLIWCSWQWITCKDVIPVVHNLTYISKQLFLISCPPRPLPSLSLSQFPPVAKQHFRRAVLQGATEGVEVLVWGHVSRTAKVDQLDVEVLVYDDVLILQRCPTPDYISLSWYVPPLYFDCTYAPPSPAHYCLNIHCLNIPAHYAPPSPASISLHTTPRPHLDIPAPYAPPSPWYPCALYFAHADSPKLTPPAMPKQGKLTTQ